MKTFFHSLFTLLFASLFFAACQDEDTFGLAPSQPENRPADGGHQSRAVSSYTSGLIQNEDHTWSALHRVPLVGSGRVVDDYANGLIDVAVANNATQNIVDLDLNNYAEFGSGLAKVEAIGNQIASVRDLHHVYKGGTKVGVVFNSTNNNLLDVKVLKNFWLTTKLTDENGNTVTQDHTVGDGSGGLLGLDLISIGNENGLKEISFITTKDFNEITFGISGITADVAGKGGLQVYYAFVGDNEVKPAVEGSVDYPHAALHTGAGWTRGVTADWNIVDNNTQNSGGFSLLGGLVQPCVTVNFGKEIPAGSEVGFDINFADILNLELGGTISLQTYNDKDQKQDESTTGKVLGLNLAGGAHRHISLVTTKPCSQAYILFAGLSVKLGATNIFYAYSRDKVEIDESSIFSMPDRMKISGNSILLPQPHGGKVAWFVTGDQPGSTPQIKAYGNRQRLVGLTKNGEYQITGVYTPDKEDASHHTIQVSSTIVRDALEPGEKCNQLIGSYYGATVDNCKGPGGTLIDIVKAFQNSENIADDNPYNYATFVDGVNIAENKGILAVKTRKKINAEKPQKVRAGFTLQSSFKLLDLKLLEFFKVKLYNGENCVAESYTKSSGTDKHSTLGISLIGTKTDRIRVYVETDQPFDRVELWSCGVLGLRLSGLHIYNAFWESAEPGAACPASGIENTGLELLTPANFDAEIDYPHTFIGEGLATVGACLNDLAKFIDNDKYTSSIIGGGLNAACASQVAIRFDEIEASPEHPQRIGIILNTIEALDVKLIDGMTLSVWHNDDKDPVARKGIGGLLEVKVFSEKGLQYLETEVTRPFNQLRLSSGDGVSLLHLPKLAGAYVRLDTDGDGIPDGSEEDVPHPDEGNTEVIQVALDAADICEGSPMTLILTEGYQENASYNVICYNQTTGKRTNLEHRQFSATSHQLHINHLPVGQYVFYVMKEGKPQVHASVPGNVHPLLTTWTGAKGNCNWNDWENWDKGTPWQCTNVVIPSDCKNYPILRQEGQYYGRNIHFAPRAELVGAQYLTYGGKAWVEMSLPVGHDYMVSSPLCNMVTGDFFVPMKWEGDHTHENYFVQLTSASSPENRFSPRIYQHFWNCAVNGKIISQGNLGDQQTEMEQEALCMETGWTRSFNAVAEAYQPGTAFVVRAERGNLQREVMNFRFPKQHEEYTYFNSNGQSTGYRERISRTPSMGRLAFEALKDGSGNYAVTLKNPRPTSQNGGGQPLFAAGNPFMAHLSIEKLIQANWPAVSEIKVSDGNTVYTVKYDGKDWVYSDQAVTHIAPMQGFYVVANSNSSSLTLKFTDAMQEEKPGYSILKASCAAVFAAGMQPYDYSMSPIQAIGLYVGEEDGSALYIEARSCGYSSRCAVRLTDLAADGYDPREDSRLLYMQEDAPTVAVFTTADGVALDIQQAGHRTNIPLGFRMKERNDVVLCLTRAGRSCWENWCLVDRVTGKRYRLTEKTTYIELTDQETQIGRFYLTNH